MGGSLDDDWTIASRPGEVGGEVNGSLGGGGMENCGCWVKG